MSAGMARRQGLPSRGSGACPCRLALYPRECQPLNRVSAPVGAHVRDASGVPETAPDLAAIRWLRSAEGAAATALAERLQAEGLDLLPGLARLRAEVGAERAGPAWEL